MTVLPPPAETVSTHSRLKAAGLYGGVGLLRNAFQHTAA